jgi:hypothetical protein
MEQIDLLFDPVFHEDQNNNELSLKNQYVDSLNKLNMHSSYIAIVSTLWNTGMPCTDLEAASDKSVLKYCAWKGQQVPCEAIFSTFPTDQGMCCTFNMKAADELLYGETYPGVIKDLQNMEKGSSSFNMYRNKEDETPETGRSKGLFVVLDSHLDITTTSSVGIVNFISLVCSNFICY